MTGRWFVTLALVLAASAFVPAAVGDPVRTDAGLLSAESATSGVRAFKGIPFGAPPVGNLRWKAPQPVAKWQGVRKSDAYGPVCVQPKGVGRLNVSVDLPDSPKASEDCLYLNVWTAAASAADKRPVMVWIFGGAYTEGAGSSKHNEGYELAKKGVVVVTFNYRLGPFGFFSHPELSTESGRHASGNYALMDAIAALRWVQTNIDAFGGNPRNVTIFGESAGAAMAAGLVGSPETKGLFQRAISESGAWMGLSMGPMRPLASAEEAGLKAAAAMGAQSLADLRARSTEEITKGIRGAGMIIDGWIVPEDESIAFAQGRQQPVDVLVGSNKDEGSFTGGRAVPAEPFRMRVREQWGDLADRVLALYPANTDAEATASSELQFRDNMAWHMRLYADAQARRGKKAWLYFFTHEPPHAPGVKSLRATHTAEIPYVFNNLIAPRVYPDASSPELAAASPRERAFADVVSSYWVNFATSGDPNGKRLPPWPAYRNGKPFVLGDAMDSKEPPDPAKLALYDELYKKQMATYAVEATASR
jgi:para-nitrobenzyl esterase